MSNDILSLDNFEDCRSIRTLEGLVPDPALLVATLGTIGHSYGFRLYEACFDLISCLDSIRLGLYTKEEVRNRGCYRLVHSQVYPVLGTLMGQEVSVAFALKRILDAVEKVQDRQHDEQMSFRFHE